MSRRKDRERAKAGNFYRNLETPRTYRQYICGNCGELLSSTFVIVNDIYYHENCPKVVTKKALIKAGRLKEEATEAIAEG